ncbi:hypothetical protein WG628_07645 [Stenotrophomonas maltophilia]|nr:hypothetical protein [Stenotrophomonas maltophilia]
MSKKDLTPSINNLLNFIKNAPPGVALNFNETLQLGLNTIRQVEGEKTRRLEIEAGRDAILKDYELRKFAIEKYLDASFNERAEVLKGKFSALDRAMESGNNEIAIAALNAIVETMKSSPLTNGGVVREMLSAGKPLMLE